MIVVALTLLASVWLISDTAAQAPPADADSVRFATYNVSLYRKASGQLIRDLKGGTNQQARQIAEVVQRVRPHVLLLCEFDYDAEHQSLEVFHDQYLTKSQNGQPPIEFAHRFTAPSNTGLASGLDLDHDGRLNGPGDAVGFGFHEGQYGMAVLSRLPIDRVLIRTLQRFLWKDVPTALLPVHPADGTPYYSAEELAVLRLSSKSFWDVPIVVERAGMRRSIHFLTSHPTPPVFDGPEDRNGRRNHDEIRLVADYLDPTTGSYLTDDHGQRGGLAADASFVVAGDLNCDPVDGSGVREGIRSLLNHPRVNSSLVPEAAGGPGSAEHHAELNADQRGDPAHDTADFSGDEVANMRVDYVLPSRDLHVKATGVFWPPPGEPGSDTIKASDHRLVWLDVMISDPADE
jgi:endonuclease/exonuclease/phosphatase family metal-dependent hydrolase